MAGGVVVGRRASALAAREYPVTDRSTRLAAVVFLIVLNGLDVITTHHVVTRLGGTEANPLSHWLITHDLLGPAKAAVVLLIGLMAMRFPPRRASSLALWLVVGFYLAVVLHNVGLIATAA